jgi:calcium uniporter protein, mitochondrial
LKLVLPLHTIIHESGERKDIEPLALLIHPQQPLSYLERLIQSELPLVEDEKGRERIPSVEFRAVDNAQDSIMPKVKVDDNEDPKPSKKDTGARSRSGVESYSGLGREHKHDDDKSSFVRWSLSTDIGDFVRDAARGREFIVRIQGQDDIMVEVPSFRDRTYYLRLRLRKTARRLKHLAALKKECDDLAHRGARRVAMGGFGILVAWVGIFLFSD